MAQPVENPNAQPETIDSIENRLKEFQRRIESGNRISPEEYAKLREDTKRLQEEMEMTSRNVEAGQLDDLSKKIDSLENKDKPKTTTDVLIEKSGSFMERIGETFASFSEKMKSVFGTMSDGALKAMLWVSELMGWKFAVDALRGMVEPREIRNAMKKELGNELVKSADNDKNAVAELRGKYQAKLTAKKLTQGTYSFETFYMEKIADLKKEFPPDSRDPKKPYTISDLLHLKQDEIDNEKAKQEEDKKLQDGKKILEDAGAKPVLGKENEWTLTANAGEKINAVSFRFTKDGWEWQWENQGWKKSGSLDRDAVKDDAEKKNRDTLNALARQLGIDEQSKDEKETKETPDEKKKRYLIKLIEAFQAEQHRTGLASYKIIPKKNSNWRDLSNEFCNAIDSKEFSSNKLTNMTIAGKMWLEFDNGNLEAGDTPTYFGTDQDILPNWSTMLKNDPVEAVKAFMKIDPQALGLWEGSRENVANIQATLRSSIDDLDNI